MKISIIIVTFNRRELLENLLHSIIQPALIDSTKHSFEILVMWNGVDETKKLIESLFPYIKGHEKGHGTPAEARNILISKAEGDYLLFLDDDVLLPATYWETAFQYLDKKLDVFGGPDGPYPEIDDNERALTLALTSPLATANTRYRHSSNGQTEPSETCEKKLILCNLWIKSSLLKQHYLKFDKRFFRNEENVLLFQLQSLGKKMLYIPKLSVGHKKKADYRYFIRAVMKSGYYRTKSFVAFPRSIDILYFVPSLFVIYLFLLLLFPTKVMCLPLLVYLFLNLIFTARIVSLSKCWSLFPRIFTNQLLINIFYGIGFLLGFLPKINL
ncbi:MAG: glycosyltransferase [Halobacteriovoraceae bacterium]|jgi:GT2 family glycosyltransferase|nr:glycosyltransferase [Halobacteriovoraceae bacterium]MBT5093772.1 glycosyltransferase [Halobacteriovoraceae bacterium]